MLDPGDSTPNEADTVLTLKCLTFTKRPLKTTFILDFSQQVK